MRCGWEYETCPQPAVARGMCKKHWTRVRRAELAGKPVDPDLGQPPPPPPPRREPVVIVPAGAVPVVCPTCGRPYAADDTIRADLLAAARLNHAYYCPGAAA